MGQGVRQFVETAETEVSLSLSFTFSLSLSHSLTPTLNQVLDREAQNRTFLDTILSSPIPQGVGLSSTNVFVDGNHSKVTNQITTIGF